jgi:hypothetical protein
MKAWMLLLLCCGCNYNRVHVDVEVQSQIIPVNVSCKIDLEKDSMPIYMLKYYDPHTGKPTSEWGEVGRSNLVLGFRVDPNQKHWDDLEVGETTTGTIRHDKDNHYLVERIR